MIFFDWKMRLVFKLLFLYTYTLFRVLIELTIDMVYCVQQSGIPDYNIFITERSVFNIYRNGQPV